MPEKPPRITPVRWLSEHGDAMYRYAMLRLGDRAAAEDAVQEALLAALKAAPSFEGRAKERTWLIGILRHKVLDVIRARSRQRPVSVHELSDETCRSSSDEWPIGPDQAESEELKAIVREELAKMESPMREALCLRVVEGLDSHIVCEILGVTATNLWTIVHRGRVKLRDRVGERLKHRGEDVGP